jgi:RHS repeat-associated protein
LRTATLANGQTVTYGYDAAGRRASRTANGQTTSFLYDGADVVKDTASDATTNYLNGLGIDDKLRQTSAGVPLYFTTDHLGSTTALTGANGAIVERQQYEAFGRNAGSGLTRYGYTGRERDEATGLLHYRARWYDPQVGRFVSEDPLGFAGGINFYSYVSNDPINGTDPTGLIDLGWGSPTGPPPYSGRDSYCKAICGQTLSCPFADQAPTDPNFNMGDNIREAEAHWILRNPLTNPGWFYNQVNDNGPWDYKRGDESKQDFGNAHFGAMCLGVGFSETNCLREAGRNQYGKKLSGQVDTSQSAGYPGGDHKFTRFTGRVADYVGLGGYLYGQEPFGDDPRDAAGIKKGFDYYHDWKERQKCGCGQ